MDVEICVQGYGYESNDGTLTDHELSDGDRADWLDDPTVSPCPIAVERWEEWFQAWLEALQPKFSTIDAYELSVRLTNDREMQHLNQQYRQQDRSTDVLAFAALESALAPPQELQSTLPLYLGDIVISLNTAQRQAEAQQQSLIVELAWLASHGLLHLLGWDHPDEDSLHRMLKQQQDLLQIVGLHNKTG